MSHRSLGRQRGNRGRRRRSWETTKTRPTTNHPRTRNCISQENQSSEIHRMFRQNWRKFEASFRWSRQSCLVQHWKTSRWLCSSLNISLMNSFQWYVYIVRDELFFWCLLIFFFFFVWKIERNLLKNNSSLEIREKERKREGEREPFFWKRNY